MSRARSIVAFAFAIVLGLLILLLIALPALASVLASRGGGAPLWLGQLLEISEGFIRWFMLVFVVVWIFFLGGTFASFLNVVAWRVPRDRSILGSSHCPLCNAKLSFRDNIPIIGWLKNSGECSHCHRPISVRYWIVEVTLGTVFLLIAGLVMMTGGGSLPFREIDWPSQWDSLIFDPKFELVQITLFFWMFCLVLYTFALVELERLKIPRSVWFVGAWVVALFLAIWPAIQIVPWQFPLAGSDNRDLISRALFPAYGILAAIGCGWLLDRMWQVIDRPNSFLFGTTIVGLSLGWQSTIVVSAIVIFLISVNRHRKPGNPIMANLLRSPHANLLLASLIHLATWRWFDLL